MALHFQYQITEADVQLAKIHPYDEKFHKWADVIFTARRDVRDALSSLKRRQEFACLTHESTILKCEELIGQQETWNTFTDYELPYVYYQNNPHKAIQDICDVLNQKLKLSLKCDTKIILKQIEDLKIIEPSSDNLLSRNHIGDGKINKYKKFLTAEEIETINTKFEYWLRKWNYLDNN